MKKYLFISLLAISFFSYSCNNDDDEASNPTEDAASALAGNWTITKYDGMALASPASGTFDVTSDSETTGSAEFKLSFDGSNINDESDDFTTSNNNSTIEFIKTGGNFNVLAGGETWTVNTLNEHNLKMTSSYGLIIEMQK